MPGETVPLKEHFEALRAADQRALELVREWVKERLESHNGLIHKMEADRELFASRDTVTALKEAFEVYKEITAKSLALAEGKSKGLETIRVAVTFVVGTLVGLVGLYAASKGLR
jgi:hypothetical protein